MLGRAHDVVTIGDASDVLHGAVFVIRTHHMINLGKWVSLTVSLLVEIKGRLGDTEDELFSEVLD